MSTLVIYYSLEGNTRLIADAIAGSLKADTLEIKTIKPFPTEGFKKFFIGGMYSSLKIRPKIENTQLDLNAYDNIIIGTPVWAGTYAAPINTFIKKNKLFGKKAALFACHAGQEVGKCLLNLKMALPDNKIIGTIDFISPLKADKAKITEEAAAWAKSLSF